VYNVSNLIILIKIELFRQSIVLMRSSITSIQCEAGRLIANLSNSTSELIFPIIKLGGHNLFVTYILSNSVPLQKIGAVGLCNLSQQIRFHQSLVDSKVIEPFLISLRNFKMDCTVKSYILRAIAGTVFETTKNL
jgi:hypothetical protein